MCFFLLAFARSRLISGLGKYAQEYCISGQETSDKDHCFRVIMGMTLSFDFRGDHPSAIRKWADRLAQIFDKMKIGSSSTSPTIRIMTSYILPFLMVIWPSAKASPSRAQDCQYTNRSRHRWKTTVGVFI